MRDKFHKELMEKQPVYLALPKRGYCLDGIVLFRDGSMVVTKKLLDAEELTSGSAGTLKTIADFFDALPIVIADRIAGEKIEENVVYSRHSMPIVESMTFEALISGAKLPLIYYSHGGVYVKIKGSKLKELREKQGLSRGALARQLGVSRRMILNYEEGLSDVSMDVALKLEELFGSEIFEEVSLQALKEVFSEKIKSVKREPKDHVLKLVFEELRSQGFSDYTFYKAPYDAGLKFFRGRAKIRVAIKRESSSEEVSIANTLSQKTRTPLLVISRGGETSGEVTEEVTVVREEDPLKVKEAILRLVHLYSRSENLEAHK